MFTLETIITMCWAVFFLYWIFNWKNAKPSQNKRNIGALRGVYIVILIVFLLNHFAFQNMLRHYHIFATFIDMPLAVHIVGALLAVAGVTTAIIARHTLADNWSAYPELKKGHTLITSGIYGYIRHPIYTGMLCMSLGTLLVYPILPVAIYCFILLTVFLLRIKKEEAMMLKTFPKAYPAYKSRTRSLLPFLF